MDTEDLPPAAMVVEDTVGDMNKEDTAAVVVDMNREDTVVGGMVGGMEEDMVRAVTLPKSRKSPRRTTACCTELEVPLWVWLEVHWLPATGRVLPE